VMSVTVSLVKAQGSALKGWARSTEIGLRVQQVRCTLSPKA
jgi:hypothetical protein